MSTVALVTGCARIGGLGHAIAIELARAGMDVAVTDLLPAGTRNFGEESGAERDGWRGLDSIVAEITAMGRRCVGLVGDVGDEQDAQRMVDEAVAALGAVDVLVNNAAAPLGADREFTWEVPVAAFDLVLQVNLRGAFLMSSAVARHLLSRPAPGRIVNIASVAGRQGMPQRAAYCSSKFAIIGLTQVLAQELAAHDITVNSVCPGAMETARTTARVVRGQEKFRGGAPRGRVGVPGDVSRLVRFLCEPEADYITGQAINVDGGLVMS